VDHHSRWFVDRHDVLIFVEDGQWYVLGRRMQRRRLDRSGLHNRARMKYERRLPGKTVDQDLTGFDPPLEPGAAEFGQTPVQKAIEALARVGGGG
jgi:hypothetical protein